MLNPAKPQSRGLSHPIQRPHVSIWLVILMAVMCGTIASCWGYTYGTGNQVEQLPIVLRAMNPNYLMNDFFVNVSSEYSPRLNFSLLIAYLSQTISLPVVYFCLTMISNVLIALASGLIAREMFDKSNIVAIVSIALVMSIKTFWLGDSNTIFGTYLEPSHLVMPLLLLAVWAGLKLRPIETALTSGIASLIHPLVGLEVGAIMFGVIIIQLFLRAPYPVIYRNKRRYIFFILIGGLVFCGFAAAVLLPYIKSESISADQFVYILAYLRHPHHYLPSQFGLLQYLQAGAFLLAAVTSWIVCLKRFIGLKQIKTSVIILSAILVLLCVGGYLFVEIYPQRIWTTLQVYRLLFVLKWLGLLVLAGWFSRVFEQRFTWLGLYENVILFVSLMTPPTMVLTTLFPVFRETLRRERPFLSAFLERGFVPFAVIVGILAYGVDTRVYVLYPLMVLLAAYLIIFTHTWITIPTTLLMTSLAILVLFQGQLFLPRSIMSRIEQPVLFLEDMENDHADLAAYVRKNTPATAVFLTPPKLGEFRLTAERAIVVDFTAFPFQESALLEWKDRMFSCYGKVESLGWQAAADMMANYRLIDDQKLDELSEKFHFEYAVLYPETQTNYPVLFQGENYKLIRISD